MLGEVCGILAVGFCDLCRSCIGEMYRLIARMKGGNEGMSSACKILGRWHDQRKMSIFAAAAFGMDGTGVGIQLLL